MQLHVRNSLFNNQLYLSFKTSRPCCFVLITDLYFIYLVKTYLEQYFVSIPAEDCDFQKHAKEVKQKLSKVKAEYWYLYNKIKFRTSLKNLISQN